MRRRDLLLGSGAIAVSSFLPVPTAAQGRHRALGYIRTNWSRDPFALGSYSFIAKGARRRDSRILAEPLTDQVFFAGEATHPEYNSTVHAAFESGLIAADAVSDTSAGRVAVIGAGISGLAAAAHLSERGYDVVVMEARGRIGGRIWTRRDLGASLDLGASWVHGDTGNPIAALARAQSIRTVPTDDSYIIRGGDGQKMADHNAPDWLEEVASVQQSFGASSSEINMRAYWRDTDYDGRELIFPKGYSQIFPALAEGLDIRLKTEVKRLEYGGDGVFVTDSAGRSTRFDAVIVTIPLGVLKQNGLIFDPALPLRKRDAIRKLGMGLLDKVYLRFANIFWDREVTWIETPENGLPLGQFNQWFNMAKHVDAPILLAFNGAGPARDLAKLDDDTLLRQAFQTLDRAYP